MNHDTLRNSSMASAGRATRPRFTIDLENGWLQRTTAHLEWHHDDKARVTNGRFPIEIEEHAAAVFNEYEDNVFAPSGLDAVLYTNSAASSVRIENPARFQLQRCCRDSWKQKPHATVAEASLP